MSNEIHCNLLVSGPAEPLTSFTDKLLREGLSAHVPIPADAEPDTPCDPGYRSRQLGIEQWGTPFIYPKPGIRLQAEAEIAEILKDIEREGYEAYVAPPKPSAGDQSCFSLTFTCPSDSPGPWIMKLIEQQDGSGLRFILRWWDRDNYWRCMKCGAAEGFCARVGALWSVAAGPDPEHPHVASWYGRSPCKCEKKTERRTIWDGSNDNPDYDLNGEICSITAIHEGGNTIRIVSTGVTGIRHMSRTQFVGSDAATEVIKINQARMHGATIAEQEEQ